MKTNYLTFVFLLAVVLTGCLKDPVLTPEGMPFTDSRDGHEYTSVAIGTQVWMAENLAYLPAVSPSTVASVTEANYYVYGFEGSNPEEAKMDSHYDHYGVLYNYVAAQTACPDGWHLPTDKEWTKLKTYLAGSPGKVLKSTTEWKENGNGANTSGFNAYPSGEQYTSPWGCSDLGSFAFYWTSTDGEYRFLSWNHNRIDSWDRFIARSESPKSFGFSVRCIQD